MPDQDDGNIAHLMDVYWTGIWKFIYALTKDREIANDLTQEVFIQAYKHLNRFRHDASVKTWLFRIARNKCYDYFRSSLFRRMVSVSRLPTGESRSAEDQVLQSIEHGTVLEAVMELRKTSREVVILHIQEEMKFAEIGRVVGVSAATAKMRYRRAIEQIRKKLEKEMLVSEY